MKPDSKKRVRDENEVQDKKMLTPVCPWTTVDCEAFSVDEWNKYHDQVDNCRCDACLKEESIVKHWDDKRKAWGCTNE